MPNVSRCSTALRVALCLPLLLALAASGLALPPSDADNELEVRRGRLLYRIHCGSCHGWAGRGDGPVAEVLKSPPPDLTSIAARRDGFSAEEVARTIDGREGIRSHGAGAMPVWGVTFQEMGRDDDREVEVEAKIAALVAYLRTIQVGETETEEER